MTFYCPYCKAPLAGYAAMPPLSKRRRRIYDAVVNAGYDGIPAANLIVAMYDDDENLTPGAHVMLRVHIHEMNKLLASVDQKITAKPYGAYRLISLNGAHYGSATQESSA